VDVWKKLQIRTDQTVRVVNQPHDVTLPVVPAPIRPQDADAFLGFVRTSKEITRIGVVLTAASKDRLAWIAYPKAGQLGTDLNRDILATLLAGRGLQPVRQVSIDDVWSGLRFRPS
jgi:hypothetical protein